MIKVQSIELEKEIHDPRTLHTTHQTDRSYDVDRAPLGAMQLPGGDRNERLEIAYSEKTNMIILRGWRRLDDGTWERAAKDVATSAINANEIVFADRYDFGFDEKKPPEKKP